jgi:hypothetical protein
VKWEARSSAESEREARKGSYLGRVEKFAVMTGESKLTRTTQWGCQAALQAQMRMMIMSTMQYHTALVCVFFS